MLDLPFPIEKVLEGIDAVIVTHTHSDHWDDVAVEKIPKEIPIFTQHAADAKLIRNKGFKDVRVTGTKTPYLKIFLYQKLHVNMVLRKYYHFHLLLKFQMKVWVLF